MARVAAFDLGDHLVADADVGEGAAHHDFMISATRAVGVEVFLDDRLLLQVFARRTRRLYRPRWRDVVGGDRVSEKRQYARAFHLQLARLFAADREEWRLADVARSFPAIGLGSLHLYFAPGAGAGKDVRILSLKHLC